MSKAVLYFPSALCLIACLIIPLLYFQGRIKTGTYNAALLVASIGWFVCVAGLAARKRRP